MICAVCGHLWFPSWLCDVATKPKHEETNQNFHSSLLSSRILICLGTSKSLAWGSLIVAFCAYIFRVFLCIFEWDFELDLCFYPSFSVLRSGWCLIELFRLNVTNLKMSPRTGIGRPHSTQHGPTVSPNTLGVCSVQKQARSNQPAPNTVGPCPVTRPCRMLTTATFRVFGHFEEKSLFLSIKGLVLPADSSCPSSPKITPYS